ncbi:hypothetical protein [Trichlorobacter ammonificans]|uniref:Uncharacterized protein n=1 Tax=Trichlorobacter ammonificans TaxID=2916410 RepID=A0ABM9D6L1_9BACT|nr:hypothetical protein [Trichlorobacter ammonificans]CAH2030033.1 protein of unknown function [Trichlorobacter ammonificans]
MQTLIQRHITLSLPATRNSRAKMNHAPQARRTAAGSPMPTNVVTYSTGCTLMVREGP